MRTFLFILLLGLNNLIHSNHIITHNKPYYFVDSLISKKSNSFNVISIDKQVLNTESTLKGKIIVLNFWYTGCGPCIKEIPQLNELVIKYKASKNIVFIAASLTDNTDALNFIKKRLNMQYHLVTSDSKLCELFKVNYYPTNIIIDGNGCKIYEEQGYKENTAHKLDSTINKLLNQ